jgi:hypothetical protein
MYTPDCTWSPYPYTTQLSIWRETNRPRTSINLSGPDYPNNLHPNSLNWEAMLQDRADRLFAEYLVKGIKSDSALALTTASLAV